MKTKSILQLRAEFDKMLNRIPKFIVSTDHLHYIIWQGILECNSHLIRLCVDKVLSDRQIAKIINDFAKFIEAMIDNTPTYIHLHLSAYYTVMLESMIVRSEEEEHYEVCSNVKRFYDFYFNKELKDIND